MLVTIVYLIACGFLIWRGVKAQDKAYKLGEEMGYNVGYAKGQLDYAIYLRMKSFQQQPTDEEFLKNLGIKPI